MVARSRRNEIFRISGAKGRLTWKGHTLNVRFSLKVSQHGEVILNFRAVPLRKNPSLLQIASGGERFATWASLTGVAPDGRTIETDYVYLGSRNVRIGPKPSTIKFAGTSGRLRIRNGSMPKSSRGLVAKYSTVGMRGFHVIARPSSYGDIRIAAATEVEDPNGITGYVSIASHKPQPILKWLKNCDETVERILDLVSLSQGRRIGWSIRQVGTGDVVYEMEFLGPQIADEEHDGLGTFLNLQPFLELALTTYASALRRRTGLDVAIYWFLFHPRYIELQLLAAITAIEHLVSRFSKRRGPPALVHPRTFGSLSKEFEAAFRRVRSRTKKVKNLAILRNRIRGLNDAPLGEKLREMLTHYRVPVEGLDIAIQAAIRARNRVVHSGSYQAGYRELYVHVVVLREVLKRFFLTLLGYSGQYHSMLNGPQWVVFPPVGGTTVNPP